MWQKGIISILAVLATSAYAEETPETQCVKLAQWVVSDTGATIAQDELLKNLLQQKVVLLGEDHDNAEHHRWQLQTIIQLHAMQPNMAIGFESFPRSVQPILDQWVDGKLSEQEFLKAVDWGSIWTYDAEFYLPMFHYARMHRIPMLALNVKRSLVSIVGERGWDNIPENEREGVSTPAPASPAYKEILEQVYNTHKTNGHGKSVDDKNTNGGGDALRRFIEGQLVWDRAMAEALKKGLDLPSTQIVVGVMGAGHLLRGAGVPYQLQDLGINASKTMLAWDGAIPCAQLNMGVADYVFGVDRLEVQEVERPRLGIILEKDDKGVKVAKVIPDSIAAGLRIKPKDYVIEVAGKPVVAVGDVVKSVQNTAWGNWLPMKIKRGKKVLSIVAKFPPQKED